MDERCVGEVDGDEVARLRRRLREVEDERDWLRGRLLDETSEVQAQADRAKDEFVSVISHELRTPLNFITGFASLLFDDVLGPLSDDQRDGVRKILLGSDRMLNLVNDLLDFARIQAGQLAIDPAPARLRPVVDEVLTSLDALAGPRGVRLHVAVPAEATGHFDADRVVQVLTNLVGNAIKFTPAGGSVVVDAAVAGDWLEVTVADTGIGIPIDRQGALFNRFYQVDMSATRTSGGTGLGLTIAKALVEAHGGAIGVESHPGAGATFRFTLPSQAGIAAVEGSAAV
jgi:signal transduction histidine kinase